MAFGGLPVSSGASLNLRFPGQWFQAETELHQNWMHDYNPTLGRYLQADPLGLVDGPSVYGNALQNPQRYVDPNGLDAAGAVMATHHQTGSGNYSYWSTHPEAAGRSGKWLGGSFSNKCNMFVYDVLAAGGHPR